VRPAPGLLHGLQRPAHGLRQDLVDDEVELVADADSGGVADVAHGNITGGRRRPLGQRRLQLSQLVEQRGVVRVLGELAQRSLGLLKDGRVRHRRPHCGRCPDRFTAVVV
jgi:hypothetical protein